MHEPNQRIEFFNSESSFGSASNLPESKYYDFTNQLISETQNIFAVLKRQLQSNERQSHQQKVDYSLRRAQILQKDTIPEHIAYLNRIQAPTSAKNEVVNCKQRLGKLLGDYQKLKKGTMIYKQFYNIYGKESSHQNSAVSLKKEKRSDFQQSEAQALVKQESIEVSYVSNKSKLKGQIPRVFTKPDTDDANNHKEVTALKEQIINLRKSIEQNRKRYQLELTNQKLLFQKRIRTYLSLDINSEQRQKVLKSQIQQYSEKLSYSLEQNIRLDQTIGKLKKDLQLLQYENEINNKQNILLSKIEKIHNTLNDLSKSHHQDKREEKIIKNIMEQNQLLLSQIKNQRKRFYQIQTSLSEEERRQCEKNKKYLQKKKAQLEQLYANFDKQRIQIVQLNYSNRSHSQTLSELKKQNDQLKQVNSKPVTLNEYPPPSILSFSMKENNFKAISKLVVQEYEGDGIEGFPYYQMLSKQFRIRFRRACLKQKQLVYKANNIEIGTITKFYTPNTIQVLIHLTNCSEHKLTNLKIKVMNANQNIIDGEYYEYGALSANEQIKVPVSLTISQYPIGPLILLLEYHAQKKEQIRILLPAHIIKTMQIKQRFTDMNLLSSTKVTIVSERKICKEINDFKQYFNIGKITGQVIRLSVFHQHTRTLIQLDLMQTKEGIDVMYNYMEGMREISEYFIKTFIFLIRKEQIK